MITTAFEPSRQAALARIAAVRPADYARSRNALNGAVTRLSPYLTHGFVSLAEVYQRVNAATPIDDGHKLVYELGWRAYFRHVWEQLGAGIHQSLHAGLLPESSYASQMPDDVLEARTGVPVIDCAVRELYATGYLHNHARMWLASYLVHLRKVHWHVGASWLYGHLLDGDLASNHLSWQWVASTGSSKPYLFNAENVQRYAPAPWHSPGSVVDASYEALERIARSSRAEVPWRPLATGTPQPPLLAAPPESCGFSVLAGNAAGEAQAETVRGRDVWLAHPWSLGDPPAGLPADTLVLGVALADFHRQQPWSARRWQFVADGMARQTSVRWYADAAPLRTVLAAARSVHVAPEPHMSSVDNWLPPAARSHPVPDLFEPVGRYCTSFSKWWNLTRLAARG